MHATYIYDWVKGMVKWEVMYSYRHIINYYNAGSFSKELERPHNYMSCKNSEYQQQVKCIVASLQIS